MNEEYLNKLYQWVSSKDNNFSSALSFDAFKQKMVSDESYAFKMYDWISSKDQSFSSKLPADAFMSKIKTGPVAEVKKKDIMESSLEGGSSESYVNDFGVKQQQVPSETTNVAKPIIEEKQVQDFSKPQQPLDFFEESLGLVNKDLIDKEEEEVTNQLNFHFGDYGFKFEEQGIGDSMKVTAKNGNTLDIDLDPFMTSTEIKESERLQKFLKDNRVESDRLNQIENGYIEKSKKIKDESELKGVLSNFNKGTQLFQKDVESFVKESSDYKNLTTQVQNLRSSVGYENSKLDPAAKSLYDEWIQQGKDLEKKRVDIIKRDEDFRNQGYKLDKIVGDYNQMKSKEGSFLGGSANAVLDGFARQGASMGNSITDLITYFSDSAGADPESYKEDLLKTVEEKKLIPKGKTIEELRGLGIDELTEVLGGDTNDIIFMLESLPIAGPGGLSPRPTPKSMFDIAHSAVLDKYRKQIKYGDKQYRNRYSNAAATTDLDMGLVDASRAGLRQVLGDDETTDQWSKMKKEEFWMGSYLGLLESVPAMIGGGNALGWAQRTAQMTAQVSDHVYEEMQNNPEFDNISEAEKSLVVAPIAIAVGALESLGLRNVISQKGLLNGVVGRALGRSVEGTSAKTFREFVQQDVESMLGRGLLTISAAGLAEFETGAAQEIAEVSVKQIYNSIKEKDMFITPESVSEYATQVLRAGLQEAVGGFIMGVPGSVSTAVRGQDFTSLPKEVFEMFQEMSKDGNYGEMLDIRLNEQILSGEITQEKADEIKSDYQKLSGLMESIPTEYNSKEKQEALGLLYSKSRLENEIARQDPTLTKKKQESLDKIKARLTEIGSESEQRIAKGDVKENIISDINNIGEVSPTDEYIVEFENEEDVPDSVKNIKSKTPVNETTADGKNLIRYTFSGQELIDNNLATELAAVTDNAAVVDDTTQDDSSPDDITLQDRAEIDLFFSDQPPSESETVSPTIVLNTKGLQESTPKNRYRDTVVKLANFSSKSLSKVLPETKFLLHETNEEFLKYAPDGRGYYDVNNNTIHINLSNAALSTVGHEVFHAVLLDKIKNNDQEAIRMAYNMMQSVRKVLPESSPIRARIDKMAEQYQNDQEWLQNEEALSELMGILSSEYKSLTIPSKNIILKWIRSVARKFGLSNTEELTKTDEDVINLMNTLAGKIGRGFEVTESDLKYFDEQQQGEAGSVGTLSVNRQSKGKASTSASKDSRSWVRRLVTDIDISKFTNQNFVTNMYDFTNAGITDIGNGIKLNLLGGRNYVPYIMDKMNRNIGDVSNLAAFNSKENAEGFVKNATLGKANLFAPHRGTLSESWQFQQHIFASLTDAILTNNILTNDELIDTFESRLSSKGGKKAFKTFKDKYKKNYKIDIKNLNDFRSNPMELVRLLDIENNYSPDLRKDLNKSISTNKKVQAAIGVKSANAFAERLSDPLNDGSSDFDIMTFVKFDPNTFEIRKTDPNALDHHPSFGWTVMAKIEGIYQPTKFHKSFDITESYTKYNKNKVEVSRIDSAKESKYKKALIDTREYRVNEKGNTVVRKGKAPFKGTFKDFQKDSFKKSNVASSAGAGPKIANLNLSEGRQQKSINELIKDGRDGGFKDSVIKDFLVRTMKFKISDVDDALEIAADIFTTLPKSFGDVKGGIKEGVKLWTRVDSFRKNLEKKNERNTRMTPAQLKQKVKDYKQAQQSTYKSSSQINDDVRAYRQKIESEKKYPKKVIDKLVKKFRDNEIEVRDNLLAKAENDAIKFEKSETRKNNLKAPLLSDQEIVDKTIEFLEQQPEYINESDTYTVGSKKKGTQTTQNRKGMSSQQAKMITEFQKSVGARPTQKMANKLRVAKFMLSQRAKGKRDIEAIKKELKNFMRKTLPADLYTKKDVVKLMNDISIANKDNIDDLYNEVVKLATTKNVAKLQSSIDGILNGKYEIVQSGRLKGIKVSMNARARINAINKNILSASATAQEIMDKNNSLQNLYNTLSQTSNPTSDTFDSMLDIQAAININNALLMENNDIAKVDALDDALSNLQGILEGGRSELKMQLELQHEEYLRQREQLYEDITGTPLDVNDPNADVESRKRATSAKRKSVKGRVVSLMTKINNSILDGVFGTAEALDGLMDRISKLPGEMFEGKSQELVTNKIDRASRELKYRKMVVGQAIQDKLKLLYGSKWMSKARDNRKDKPTGIFIDKRAVDDAQSRYDSNPSLLNKKLLAKAIEENELIASQNKLYYLYNQYKDPANHPSFENDKMFGKDYARVMAEVEAKLDPEVKDFADWQVNEFFPALYLHYNEKYKNIYRTNLPWNQFYAGKIYRQGIEEKPLDLLAGNSQYSTSVGASSTKFRVNSKAPIVSMDGTDALVTYINDMEYFAAFAEPIRDINKLFTNETITTAIKDNHGEMTMKLIKDSIQKIANKGVRTDITASFINGMNNVFILSRIALSPVIMLKQMSSFITYSNDIGYANWIKYSLKSLPSVIKTFKEVKEHSVYLKERYSDSMMRQIESYSETQMQEFVPNQAKDFFVNFLMWTTKFGDATAIYMGGIPNYNFYKAEFKKQNPTASESEVIDYAIRKFERDTKRTQQSSDLQDRDIFQTSNPLVRASNMFLTTPKQYLRKEIQAVRGIYRKVSERDLNAGKGTLLENLRTLFTYHVVAPVFFQYIAQGLPGMLRSWRDDDDEDLIRAAILGNINGLFILGEVFVMAADFFSGKPWAGENAKSVGLLTMAASLVQKAKKAQSIKDPKKQAEAWHKFQLELATLTGIPAPTLDRFVENYSKVIKGNQDPGESILRLFNYSEYQISGPPEKSAAKEKGMSKENMKLMMPDLYEELEEIKKSMRGEEYDQMEKQMKNDIEDMKREMYGAEPIKRKK